jgi:hypothetical protein
LQSHANGPSSHSHKLTTLQRSFPEADIELVRGTFTHPESGIMTKFVFAEIQIVNALVTSLISGGYFGKADTHLRRLVCHSCDEKSM